MRKKKLFKIVSYVEERKHSCLQRTFKARFIHRISALSNAIETIDNEMICLIIYCLNCIRHGRNATYKRGVIQIFEMFQHFLHFSHINHEGIITRQEEDFQLEKYKTELGKDYKRITMYLCTTVDFEMSEDNNPINSELSFSKPINVQESSLANGVESASVITSARSSLDKNGTLVSFALQK